MVMNGGGDRVGDGGFMGGVDCDNGDGGDGFVMVSCHGDCDGDDGVGDVDIDVDDDKGGNGVGDGCVGGDRDEGW